MADVQSDKASTQAHDTPSSAKVEEQKCFVCKKQFGASENVLTLPCKHKSCLKCLSEEEARKLYGVRPIMFIEMCKVKKYVCFELMFAMPPILVCALLLYFLSDLQRPLCFMAFLEHGHLCMIQPMLYHLLLRYFFTMYTYKEYIFDQKPAENTELAKKKYYEGRAEYKESLLALADATLTLIVVFESIYILMNIWAVILLSC